MNIIGNPPFYEAKPAGKKRAAAHLDIKIWDKICRVFEKHEIVFIMSHSCNQMKNHGYTAISDEEQFPGVGISICIFERKPGEKPVEIISKYELNGKLDWLREHDMTKVCNHTLWHLIDRDWNKLNKLTEVPEGYLAFQERSGAHINTWLPGEEKLSKTSCYVKTNNPEEMQKFFDEKVSPEYEKFIKEFGDKNVDRGFTKTIVVPEDEIKEIEEIKMNIIMNPPYGNLHLKILNNAIKTFPEAKIVNLSPIRWLEDPLAEYKKNSDFKRFENLRKHIENVEKIPAKEAQTIFGAAIGTDLGIYTITKDGDWDSKSLWNKIVQKYIPIFLKNGVLTDAKTGKFEFAFPGIHGNIGCNNFYEVTSPDWNIAKNVKVEEKRICVKFNTEEEIKNMYDTLFTRFYKYFIFNMRTDYHLNMIYFLPLLDFTKKWTDEMLYKYFDLTEDEIKEIEEIK